MINLKVRLSIIMLTAALRIFLFSCKINSQKKPEVKEEMTRLLQARLDSLTDNQIVPGATLSIRLSDGTNISLASGLADIEEKNPMKPDDIMFSGSVGKPYVAAVVLRLYEQGLIDLKTKVGSFLKDEDWFQKFPNASDITVEMLLNHTAGIPEYVYHNEVWEAIKKDPDKEWSVEERLSYVLNDPPSNLSLIHISEPTRPY